MITNIDLDSIVDYRLEYSTAVEKAKIVGDNLTGLCPFHQDKNASFSVDLKTGKFKCFACGKEGNFVTFYAETNRLDTKTAYKQILEKYHVEPQKKEYTVSDYALEKRLPENWLVEKFHLESKIEKDGSPYIYIPYFGEDGTKVLHRKRFPKSASTRFKWSFGSSGKLLMYGEWNLKFMRDVEKSAILVEGESDTQTLLYLGLQALGIPGATTFHEEWCGKLKGIENLYLHVEPDKGGQAFFSQMCQKLLKGGYEGNVFRWTCADFGVKDPSDLYIKYGAEEAKQKITQAIIDAKPVDIAHLAETLPDAIEGQPIKLRQPEGFIYSKDGLSLIDERTNAPVLFCRTPILITRRLRSIDTGDERIELAFMRDGEWHTIIQNRSTVFQSKSIPTLADQGCTITSENAKYVVRFLEKLESENIDIIEKNDSASTFGWIGSKRFLPGLAPNVVLDIEPSLRSWANAYTQSGTLEDWVFLMSPHRARSPRFRFILAAAFAAPLLRIINQRIFFVYNWGGSKGGKSAALKAALSVWGDPERLMVNFNATQVALERMAGFYCDLPLGLDERQLAGNNQGSLEKIVYMLGSGTGRARGSKAGGLQALQTWRSVILATGEEPIVTETSQTGVSTRILELYGAPFADEKEASIMHQKTAEIHGLAGTEFLKKIIDLGEDTIKERYQKWFDYVHELNEGKNGSHSSGIAAVAVADTLISEMFFYENEGQAEAHAKTMLEEIVRENRENTMRDVNEGAKDFVADWIASNQNAFGSDKYGQQYGIIDDTYAYVVPSILRKSLEDGGFSYRKTMKYFAEENITRSGQGDGNVGSVVKRIGKTTQRMVAINLRKVGCLESEFSALKTDDEIEKCNIFSFDS